ncbi:FAD-dependent oxidoreductase [Nonomuraea ferruginea]
MTRTGLPFDVAAAVRVEDQAQFHPRKFLLALVRRMADDGARVFERTRVMGLEEGRPCRLACENGTTVTARRCRGGHALSDLRPGADVLPAGAAA